MKPFSSQISISPKLSVMCKLQTLSPNGFVAKTRGDMSWRKQWSYYHLQVIKL